MNCRRVAALLSDSLEGLPAGRDAAEVSGHLRGCPACRRLRDQIGSLEGRVREVVQSQPDPFPHLRERALERWLVLEKGTASARHGRRLLPEKVFLKGYALSGAALAVAAVVLALAGRPQHGDRVTHRRPISLVGFSHP